ncbi:hypothetical protein I552_5914 [Mycobacterium xenopi 3993]|nr:hypothetical protein I552_5914 [Mycobacterium xenopi 3993]
MVGGPSVPARPGGLHRPGNAAMSEPRSGDAPRASRRRAIAVVVAAWSPRVW